MDGVVWWFLRKKFYDVVGARWKRQYGMDHPIDLNDTAFDPNGLPWISAVNLLIPFSRAEAQQGFFTMAGRRSSDHAVLIRDVLSDESLFGGISVPRACKGEIRRQLERMNVHARSLQYPGADRIGWKLGNVLNDRPMAETHPVEES